MNLEIKCLSHVNAQNISIHQGLFIKRVMSLADWWKYDVVVDHVIRSISAAIFNKMKTANKFVWYFR